MPDFKIKELTIKTLFYIFSILILLLLIDIFTGIWYWNRLNLIFSDSAFNNILSPIINTIAVVVYFITLQKTLSQNKTINSFSFYEAYLKEIPLLVTTYKDDTIQIDENKYIDSINFYNEIQTVFTQLWSNKDFVSDLKVKNYEVAIDEIEKKSYYRQFLLINIIIRHFDEMHFYRLRNFIYDVIGSNLITEHKKKIISEIEKEILHDYLSFSFNIDYSNRISTFSQGSNYVILYNKLDLSNIESNNIYKWTNLNDTSFIEFYYWYKNFLKESKIKN